MFEFVFIRRYSVAKQRPSQENFYRSLRNNRVFRAHQDRRSKRSRNPRVAARTSGEHAAAFATGECACAADRWIAQTGNYVLDRLGKWRTAGLRSAQGAGLAAWRNQIDADRFVAFEERRGADAFASHCRRSDAPLLSPVELGNRVRWKFSGQLVSSTRAMGLPFANRFPIT